MYVMPVSVGSFKLGAAFGGFDGYMHFNDGAWFPAIVPAVEYEGQRWGLNVVYIPSLSDRIQSVLSFQIKYRFEP